MLAIRSLSQVSIGQLRSFIPLACITHQSAKQCLRHQIPMEFPHTRILGFSVQMFKMHGQNQRSSRGEFQSWTFDQAETDGWVFSGKKWALYRFHKALQEAALNGDVAVWGRRLKRGWDLVSAVRIYPIEPIDAVFFREHWIDVHQAWMHKENAFVVTSKPAQIEPEFYSDLHVDRSQASAWLHGEARHVRQQVEKNPSN